MKSQIIALILDKAMYPQTQEKRVCKIVERNICNYTKEDCWIDLMRAASKIVSDLFAFGVIRIDQIGEVGIEILNVMGVNR